MSLSGADTETVLLLLALRGLSMGWNGMDECHDQTRPEDTSMRSGMGAESDRSGLFPVKAFSPARIWDLIL